MYSPYGVQTISSGSRVTPFGFQGSYTDSTGLVYLIDRYYDPSTDQFLSVDPDVSLTDQPYVFVNDDPLNAGDALGTVAVPFEGGGCVIDCGHVTTFQFPTAQGTNQPPTTVGQDSTSFWTTNGTYTLTTTVTVSGPDPNGTVSFSSDGSATITVGKYSGTIGSSNALAAAFGNYSVTNDGASWQTSSTQHFGKESVTTTFNVSYTPSSEGSDTGGEILIWGMAAVVVLLVAPEVAVAAATYITTCIQTALGGDCMQVQRPSFG